MHIHSDSTRARNSGSTRQLPWKVRLSNAAYGVLMNTLFNRRFSPQQMRRNFDFFAAMPLAKIKKKFADVVFSSTTVGAVRTESICAVANPTRAILYLHGGGYVFGSIETYRRRAIKLSYRCRAQIIMPDYRLAPEHPFPAAFDDALGAWRYMATMHSSRSLFIAGDSAGGGLAVSLATELRNMHERSPSGVIALSPWTDLALTGASMQSNRSCDSWLKRDQLGQWSDFYRGAVPATHPSISPLYADLSGLPPLLVFAGDQEILLDDARRLVQKARRAGVSVQEEIGQGMQHDWPLTLPWLDESRRAWNTIAQFVAAHDRERPKEWNVIAA